MIEKNDNLDQKKGRLIATYQKNSSKPHRPGRAVNILHGRYFPSYHLRFIFLLFYNENSIH